MISEIERYCNNYFNPHNNPKDPTRNHPPEFLELVERIRQWREENPPSNLVSEMVVGLHQNSFATTPAGLPAGWQQVFAGELAAWKRAKFI